jgi:hypothetical protein
MSGVALLTREEQTITVTLVQKSGIGLANMDEVMHVCERTIYCRQVFLFVGTLEFLRSGWVYLHQSLHVKNSSLRPSFLLLHSIVSNHSRIVSPSIQSSPSSVSPTIDSTLPNNSMFCVFVCIRIPRGGGNTCKGWRMWSVVIDFLVR